METHSSILAWRRMDRGMWWAMVPKVAESDMTEVTLHACMHAWSR